jgi:hypothetical protein
MASGGSGGRRVLEHSTHDPKIKGLTPDPSITPQRNSVLLLIGLTQGQEPLTFLYKSLSEPPSLASLCHAL